MIFYSIRFSTTQKVAETRFLGTSSPPAPKKKSQFNKLGNREKCNLSNLS